MDLKRLTSALLGLPMVILILILGNKYITDIMFALVAGLSLHEYFNAVSKISNPVRILGYISCLIIAIIPFIPLNLIPNIIMYRYTYNTFYIIYVCNSNKYENNI